MPKTPRGKFWKISSVASRWLESGPDNMTPSHAAKKDIRYGYYVSESLPTGNDKAMKGQRIPAAHIESLVYWPVTRMARLIRSRY
jgi:hypothetical protein